MKSGTAAPNYSIYGIILNRECGTAPINACGLIIHDTVCILVKYTPVCSGCVTSEMQQMSAVDCEI